MLILATILSWQLAAAHPLAYFQQFNSEFMEVLDSKSPYYQGGVSPYPWWARVVQQESLKWTPTGRREQTSATCDAWSWQERLEKAGGSAKQYQLLAQQYVNQCELSFQGPWLNPVFQAIKSLWIRLEPRQYSLAKHVLFHLPNGVKLKGFLALKGDLKKRPLIVLRAGIFSNTQEFFPERAMFIQFFEQSPFNFLMLESLSGADFVKNNNAISMVGFDEGLQNYMVIKNLVQESQPMSKIISSVHLVALSMGGHGAFYTTLLDATQAGPPLITSMLGFCPLVDYRATTDFHSAASFSMSLMNYYSSQRLPFLKEKIPDLKADALVSSLTQYLDRTYRAPLVGWPKDFKLAPVSEQVLQDKNSNEALFSRLNNFWPGYHHVQTPVLIFATPKDHLVPFDRNSQKLMDHRIDVGDSDLAVNVFPEGYHCSFPAAYDWSFITTLGQSFFMSTLKTDLRKGHSKSIDLKSDLPDSGFIGLEFSSAIGLSHLQATISYGEQEFVSDIALTDTDFAFPNGFSSEDEILAVRRWAHQNVHALRQGNQLLLQWKSWQ